MFYRGPGAGLHSKGLLTRQAAAARSPAALPACKPAAIQQGLSQLPSTSRPWLSIPPGLAAPALQSRISRLLLLEKRMLLASRLVGSYMPASF